MTSTVQTPLSSASWQDWHLVQIPESQQLNKFRAYLDLIVCALFALAEIDTDAILQAAEQLSLDSVVSENLLLFAQKDINNKTNHLNVEQARALVLIISYLAKQHQELIRRAVSLLEQMVAEQNNPHQTALLGDYLNSFSNLYRERIQNKEYISSEQLALLADKLLIDLLFYSGFNGHRRLWLALINQAS